RFRRAAAWCAVGIALSVIGFTHSYEIVAGDVITRLAIPVPVWTKWSTGYLIMAVVFLIAPYLTRPRTAETGGG
ncbi:MAG: hypothetical protein AAFX10_10390, partial [Pseudomonadota bacterium]